MSSYESKREEQEKISAEVVHFQKMLFVFNALLSGWTVRMIGDNTFKFKKDRKNQEVNLDNYLRNFIVKNLNVDNISTFSNDTN